MKKTVLISICSAVLFLQSCASLGPSGIYNRDFIGSVNSATEDVRIVTQINQSQQQDSTNPFLSTTPRSLTFNHNGTRRVAQYAPLVLDLLFGTNFTRYGYFLLGNLDRNGRNFSIWHNALGEYIFYANRPVRNVTRLRLRYRNQPRKTPRRSGPVRIRGNGRIYR